MNVVASTCTSNTAHPQLEKGTSWINGNMPCGEGGALPLVGVVVGAVRVVDPTRGVVGVVGEDADLKVWGSSAECNGWCDVVSGGAGDACTTDAIKALLTCECDTTATHCPARPAIDQYVRDASGMTARRKDRMLDSTLKYGTSGRC
jgi:hypothetical protein